MLAEKGMRKNIPGNNNLKRMQGNQERNSIKFSEG